MEACVPLQGNVVMQVIPSGAGEAAPAKVLASGLAEGQTVEVLEYTDGSLTFAFDGNAASYRWPQEQTEACISTYLRMLRG